MSARKEQLDGRIEGRMENYSKFWVDPSKEKQGDTDKRLESYTEVVNGYYDGATGLYEFGWSTSFHFCRFYKGESFYAALARHEHYLAAKMGLRPGMRVLDVGCGIGGPAREIARFADVQIVGVNNNRFQVGRATAMTKRAGLQGQITYVQGDFMKLAEQFGENSFDAVYAIEATVHAPTFEGVYGEIMKVLKPGGKFGVYEWAMTDAWDPSIPEHKEIAHRIEIGDGVPEMRTVKQAHRALKNVGFQVEHQEDLAERPDEVPWYYPLEGKLFQAQTAWDLVTVWRNSWSGRIVTHYGLWAIEKIGVVPKGTWEVGETLKIAGDVLVESGKKKLFTPMLLSICKKPE